MGTENNLAYKPVTLLPLVEGGNNEKVAEALSKLFSTEQEATTASIASALLVLAGIDAYLRTDDPEKAEVIWKPVLVARKMIQDHAERAYLEAIKLQNVAITDKNQANLDLYTAVAGILIRNADQLKN